MKLLIVLLLANFEFTTPLHILKDHVDSPRNFRQNSEFTGWIRKWFQHSKERIYETLFGITTPPPLPPEPEEFDFSEFESCLRNREKLLVDVSMLSFDPADDWGFRIGKWYFIRKANENHDEFNSDSGEWDVTSSTLAPEETIIFGTAQTVDTELKDPEMTELPSTVLITSPTTASPTDVVTQNETQSATQTSTLGDLSGEFTPEMEKPALDNDIDNTAGEGSVEVFMK